MGKRTPPSAAQGGSSGKKPKQQSLKDSFMQAARSTAHLPVNVVNSDVAELGQAYTHDLEAAFDNYCQKWSDKCGKESNTTRGGATREDVDLDGAGMNLVTSFKGAAQVAAAQGVAVPSQFLEAMALVARNDIVHQSSYVSRAAQGALLAYLAARPYAKLSHYSAAQGAASEGLPYVVVTRSNAWLPLEEDRDSFTSKYLLLPDMAIAGRNYRADRGASGGRRQRETKFSCAADFMLHCLEKGVNSADMDFNGDLQLFDYVLTVLEQDLDVRTAAYKEMKERPDAASTQGLREGLLVNSLAWRIFTDQLKSADLFREIIRSIVSLIAIDGAISDEALMEAEEEPDDDAPAGQCICTRTELAAMGARLLRLLLRLFGTAEASGAFHATAKHRAAKSNYRMAIDENLLGAFWCEKGLCKSPEAARSLLRAMPPRDCLRLLGLLAAQKFTSTYGTSLVGKFATLIGDLEDDLKYASNMLARGTDVDSFFEVPMCAAVASLSREPSRAVKTYRSLDHLAVMLAAVASAAYELTVRGEEVPTGPEGIEGLKRELNKALSAVAGLANGGGQGGVVQMSQSGVGELMVAQMTVKVM